MAGSCGSACPVAGGYYSYQPSISGNTTFIAIYALLAIRKTTLLCLIIYIAPAPVARVRWQIIAASHQKFEVVLFDIPAGYSLGATVRRKHHTLGFAFGNHRRYKTGVQFLQIGMLGLVVSVLGLEVAGAVLLCYGQSVLQKTKSPVIIVTGLGVQIFCLVLLFGMCVMIPYGGSKCSYGHRVLAHNDDSLLGKNRRGKQAFFFRVTRILLSIGLQAAGVVLLIHSVYRLAEMSLGVSGTLFQSETAFMIANGAFPLVYCMLLSIFHPRNSDRSASVVTSPVVYEERKGRLPPLAHRDAHPAHHGYSPNLALQISPTSQKSHSSNHAEMPSASPGLPVNPRPTQKSVALPTPTQTLNISPAPSPNLGNQNKTGKKLIASQSLVKTDSLW
ncbi:hypothetical protein LLEC1_02563 [Akanthomyces lecanii]|uniref:Uncharacterized protein n=1 Tax=Cordyceps confragosa TaxID=2714763 RepID=A0A179IB07_CORDF|nr:hypothetical protein LLEC1_02563 [Akanthomyces lecanii]